MHSYTCSQTWSTYFLSLYILALEPLRKYPHPPWHCVFASTYHCLIDSCRCTACFTCSSVRNTIHSADLWPSLLHKCITIRLTGTGVCGCCRCDTPCIACVFICSIVYPTDWQINIIVSRKLLTGRIAAISPYRYQPGRLIASTQLPLRYTRALRVTRIKPLIYLYRGIVTSQTVLLVFGQLAHAPVHSPSPQSPLKVRRGDFAVEKAALPVGGLIRDRKVWVKG